MQHIFCIFAKNFYFAHKLYLSTLRVERPYLMLGQLVRRIRKGDLTAGEKEMLQNALDFYYNSDKKKEDSI
jgi:hypothetical protein